MLLSSKSRSGSNRDWPLVFGWHSMAFHAKIIRMNKTCKKCGLEKPITDFALIAGGKYRVGHCHDCELKYQREWSKSEKGRESINRKDRKRYAKDPLKKRAHAKAYRDRRNERIFAIYGAACACCGESERTFLTIDHIKNDGGVERKNYGGNEMFRNWLVKQPKLENYQTLCWNCQWGRRINGICPHQAGAVMTGTED
jgi:hypothetical protein